MTRRNLIALAAVLALLWCASETRAAEEGRDTPGDWYSCLKDIPLGPGRLDIGGSFRTRFEYFNNFHIRGYLDGYDDDILLERVRLSFRYRLTDKVRFFVEGQDSHFWLNRFHVDDWPASCPYQNHMDLRQAYVECDRIGDTPWGFKIGRQSISYADKRVFGPGNWGNVGRYWWDAARVTYDAEAFRVDAIWAERVRTDPHEFDDQHFSFDMLAAYVQVKKLPVKLDLFYTLRYNDHGTTVGESGAGDRRTHSVGCHLDGKRDNWDYGGTFVMQRGKWGRDDIRAYGANARLGYTFDAAWAPRLGLDFSYGSGDSDPTDGDHETFDGVFGAVDCFYGRMNLFSWMNLQDYQLNFTVKPRKRLKVWLAYHFFRLDEARDAWYYCNGRAQRQDVTGNSGSTLGHEIDLMAKWNVTKNVELFAGYAHFFPGSFLRNTPGGSSGADWAFLQFMYSF